MQLCRIGEQNKIDNDSKCQQVYKSLGIFRLSQSVPSKKAEPVKQWLAQLGRATYRSNH